MNKKFLHFLMMACCILPLIAVLLYAPQLKSNLSGSNLSWLIILICPLMHIVMMKFMPCSKNDKKCHDDDKNEVKQ